MKARLLELNVSPFGGKQKLTLELEGDFGPQYLELKDKLLDFSIAEYREKRSRNANNYAWALIGKLSAKLNIPPKDIYQNYIKDVGDNYTIVCVKDEAVKSLRDGWSNNGIGWVSGTMDSKIPGCTNVFLFYGSSTYDTAQMSRLINLIVDDCKANGIETESQDYIDSLIERWK